MPTKNPPLKIIFIPENLAMSKIITNFASSKREDRGLLRVKTEIALWCNGSTQVSGTFSEGSSPSKATISFQFPLPCGVMVARRFLAPLVRVRVLPRQHQTVLNQLIRNRLFYHSPPTLSAAIHARHMKGWPTSLCFSADS